MTNPSPVAAERAVRVNETLADVRKLLAGKPLTRELLSQVTARLEKLASQKHLFDSKDFPPPAPDASVNDSTRYRLNPDDGNDGLALYLNSLNPGKTTVPHNHTTWAIIVAVAGDELNRVYQRLDDGSDANHAKIAQVREQVVRPGSPIAFLPDDIHSIHVTGKQPTLHFHLYGKPLETLTGRVGYDVEAGRVINYNKTQMKPGEEVRV